jgi:hypothetical protein
VPVIQTGPADGFFGDVKAQGPDQMESGTGGGTGAGDIAAVLGDFRLYQNNIQHGPHLRTSLSYSCRSQNPLGVYCMPKLSQNQSKMWAFPYFFIVFTKKTGGAEKNCEFCRLTGGK